MREIKFRAWHKESKKMLRIQKMSFRHNKLLPYKWDIEHDGCEFELMQYTGLKDKSSKEIYEGDIIETYFVFSPGDAGYGVSQKPFIVSWDCERLAFRAKKPKSKEFNLLDTIDFFTFQPQIYKVIGNIYENPELLETK